MAEDTKQMETQMNGKDTPHDGHDHQPGEHCGSPSPWMSFGLTAGLAAIMGLVGWLAWTVLR